MKIRTGGDSGDVYQLAQDIGVNQALHRAVKYMARYYFEPERPDLLPDPDERLHFGRPGIGFVREEMRSACNARLELSFTKVDRITQIELEEGEPLYLYTPEINISWATSGYTPAEALKAGEIHEAAGKAGLGLVGHMAGTWISGPWCFPSGALNGDEYNALLDLIGV